MARTSDAENEFRRPKDTVLFYRSWIETFENPELGVRLEDIGYLTLAAAHYVMDGIEPEFHDPVQRFAFGMMRGQLDADYTKWLASCKRNKDNRNANKNKTGDQS